MDLDELSGLEILKKAAKGELSAPMDEIIPLKITHVERGIVSGTVIAGIEHLSFNKGIHSGFYASALASITDYAFHIYWCK